MRGEHLLAHAAHRQHPPSQRDLAGHGDFVLDRAAGKSRNQRGSHGDPRAGAVFGHRPFGHMDVDVGLLEQRRVHAKGGCVCAQVRKGCLRGFLHHIADLAGDLQIAFALHEQHFHRHHRAAIHSPGQAQGHAHFVFLFGFQVEIHGRPQKAAYGARGHPAGEALALGFQAGDFTADPPNFPL